MYILNIQIFFKLKIKFKMFNQCKNNKIKLNTIKL